MEIPAAARNEMQWQVRELRRWLELNDDGQKTTTTRECCCWSARLQLLLVHGCVLYNEDEKDVGPVTPSTSSSLSFVRWVLLLFIAGNSSRSIIKWSHWEWNHFFLSFSWLWLRHSKNVQHHRSFVWIIVCSSQQQIKGWRYRMEEEVVEMELCALGAEEREGVNFLWIWSII